MAIHHDVERLCYNKQADSWIFICTKDNNYGYSISHNLQNMPQVLAVIVKAHKDFKEVINTVAARSVSYPHSLMGSRAVIVPEPRQC